MRKLLFILLSTIFLTACGDNSDTSADSKSDANAEVTALKYYEWLDESIDYETISVYAEIKNTGKGTIDVNEAKLTYLDSNGSVIAVNNESITPRFLNEGDVGYVIAEVQDDIQHYNDLDDIEIELSPEPFESREIVNFTVRDAKYKNDNYGPKTSQISVTGFFENESDIDFSNVDTYASVGFYDENDNFLGAEPTYIGQEFSIGANEETSFEIGGGTVTNEIGKNIKKAKIKAVGMEEIEDF